jgi:hypothetical protein
VDVVTTWTGSRADALRRALRMTNEAFAEHLGVAGRTVAYWRERADVVPRPAMQEILDAALAQAPTQVRAQFSLILAEDSETNQPDGPPPPLGDIADLTTWITASNTSDAAIDHLEQAAVAAGEMHARAPAREVLAEVIELHRSAQQLLQRGKQRLRQTRRLIRLDGDILAHASVLLGDLGQDRTADNYGHAALLCLQEAEASEATAWYALAKTARWRHSYAAAAEAAHRGLADGPVTPMSVQLASYEANAAALLGDRARARQALTQAESIAELVPSGESSLSPWSFPAGRQAMFRLSVLLHTGDPGGALQAAAAAEDSWAAGGPHNPGTWAQVRTGAAIAHLLQDSLDGAVEQVTPVLALAPGMRIATVTGWLADLDDQLAARRFGASKIGVSLRDQIHEFTVGALRHTQTGRAR